VRIWERQRNRIGEKETTMLSCECVSVSGWTWVGEHDKFLKSIFSWCEQDIFENFLLHKIEFKLTWQNIIQHGHRWDENGWK
jgi:hypothetical protein